MHPRRAALLLAALALAAATLWLLVPRNDARDPAASAARLPATAPAPESRDAPVAIDSRPFGDAPFPAPGSVAIDSADTSVLEGVVLAPDGRPVPEAAVAVFPQLAERESRWPLAAGRSDADGRFRLAVPAQTSFEAVVCAEGAKSRPASLPLRIEARSTRSGLVLQLAAPAGIHGVVRLNGEPFTNCVVEADVAPGVPGLFPGDDELWWTGGAAEIKRATAAIDRQGRYAFEGLSPAPYVLAVRARGAPMHPDLAGERVPVAASAPAARRDFDLDSASLSLSVTDGERPIACELSVRSAATGERWSTGGMSRSLRVRAGVAYVAELAARGFHSGSVAIPPLERGETRRITIAMERHDAADLRIDLKGSLDPGDALKLAFLPAQPIYEARDETAARLREALVARRDASGRWLIEDVPYPPGRYTVVFAPEDRSAWLLPASVPIELKAGGIVEVAVDGRAGGRIGVAIRRGGAPAAGEWDAIDGNGRSVLSGWYEPPSRSDEADENLTVMSDGGRGAQSLEMRGTAYGGTRPNAPLCDAAVRPSRRSEQAGGDTVALEVPDPTDAWRRAANLLEPGLYRVSAKDRPDAATEVVIEAGATRICTVHVAALGPSSAARR